MAGWKHSLSSYGISALWQQCRYHAFPGPRPLPGWYIYGSAAIVLLLARALCIPYVRYSRFNKLNPRVNRTHTQKNQNPESEPPFPEMEGKKIFLVVKFETYFKMLKKSQIEF